MSRTRPAPEALGPDTPRAGEKKKDHRPVEGAKPLLQTKVDTTLREWRAATQTDFVPTGRGDGKSTTGPEDVLLWLFGLFYSPEYRRRYRAALAHGFPLVLLPSTREFFRALSRIGGELVSLQLLESPVLAKPITEFIGGRNPEVEKVSWSQDTVWIDKAQITGFRGVPEEVWNFHIGGYQVCAKWLKDRQARGGKNPRPGRRLLDDDIAQYQKIVAALNETMRLMKEIDEVIEQHGGWPGAFKTGKISTQGSNEST